MTRQPQSAAHLLREVEVLERDVGRVEHAAVALVDLRRQAESDAADPPSPLRTLSTSPLDPVEQRIAGCAGRWAPAREPSTSSAGETSAALIDGAAQVDADAGSGEGSGMAVANIATSCRQQTRQSVTRSIEGARSGTTTRKPRDSEFGEPQGHRRPPRPTPEGMPPPIWLLRGPARPADRGRAGAQPPQRPRRIGWKRGILIGRGVDPGRSGGVGLPGLPRLLRRGREGQRAARQAHRSRRSCPAAACSSTPERTLVMGSDSRGNGTSARADSILI